MKKKVPLETSYDTNIGSRLPPKQIYLLIKT